MCELLLLNLYLFYKYSSLNRANLKASFRSLGQQPLVPKRVGGTRWLPDTRKALEHLSGYQAKVQHLEQMPSPDSIKRESSAKAHNFLKAMKDKHQKLWLHFILDTVTCLADVSTTMYKSKAAQCLMCGWHCRAQSVSCLVMLQVEVDPVVAYLEKITPLQPEEFNLSLPFQVPHRQSERLKRQRQKETTGQKNDRRMKKAKTTDVDQLCTSRPTSLTSSPVHLQQAHSCDVRLRVKVEYVDHQEVLGNSVHSHKRHEKERQFEKFSQASTILKSRDLGTVVCDIKFSELTSLDAFWRDYTNGALLEALKVVFITESLNEAVGHEPLRLLVSVDEDDFRKGRLILLKNLTR